MEKLRHNSLSLITSSITSIKVSLKSKNPIKSLLEFDASPIQRMRNFSCCFLLHTAYISNFENSWYLRTYSETNVKYST